MKNKILRLPAVKEATGLSRSLLYQMISDNKFPRPVQLGARAVGWLECDVNEWLEGKISESRVVAYNG
jgi:prophage regulatory protein